MVTYKSRPHKREPNYIQSTKADPKKRRIHQRRSRGRVTDVQANQ